MFYKTNSKILLQVLINKCVLNFRYIFSIGGEHFKVRAYRIYIYFYAEKFFCLIFRGQGQLAGGSYLRISLYVLMIHFKKFGTFIRSVPISRLSNRTKPTMLHHTGL